MIEILLGVAAIVLAVIAIAEVKSSTKEIKEEIDALSAAEGSDRKVIQAIKSALYNKVPEISELQDVYNKVRSDPGVLSKVEKVAQRGASVLYKEEDIDHYFQLMFKLAQDAYAKKIPEELANKRIRYLLISLIYKRQGMGEIAGKSRYVPKAAD